MIKYLLRIEDEEFWKKARIKAIKQKIYMKDLFIALLRKWVKGEIEI